MFDSPFKDKIMHIDYGNNIFPCVSPLSALPAWPDVGVQHRTGKELGPRTGLLPASREPGCGDRGRGLAVVSVLWSVPSRQPLSFSFSSACSENVPDTLAVRQAGTCLSPTVVPVFSQRARPGAPQAWGRAFSEPRETQHCPPCLVAWSEAPSEHPPPPPPKDCRAHESINQ